MNKSDAAALILAIRSRWCAAEEQDRAFAAFLNVDAIVPGSSMMRCATSLGSEPSLDSESSLADLADPKTKDRAAAFDYYTLASEIAQSTNLAERRLRIALAGRYGEQQVQSTADMILEAFRQRGSPKVAPPLNILEETLERVKMRLACAAGPSAYVVEPDTLRYCVEALEAMIGERARM